MKPSPLLILETLSAKVPKSCMYEPSNLCLFSSVTTSPILLSFSISVPAVPVGSYKNESELLNDSAGCVKSIP